MPVGTATSQNTLRFFPLLPVLGRTLGHVIGGPGAGVLVVANVAALVYGSALAWLVRVELGSTVIASRVAWLIALSPGAVVLGLGYAEGLAGAFTVPFFLALVAVGLCVASYFLLPFHYTAWAAVTIFLGTTSATVASMPRYLFSAFPLLVAGAALVRTEAQWTAVITISAATFAAFAVIGFTPIYTL